MNKGEKAKVLVEDGFIDDLAAAAKAAIVQQWSRAESMEEREECWAELRAVDTVLRAIVGLSHE